MQFNNPKTESRELIPGLGHGFSEVDGWLPLVEQPLLILVGLTGVGKSTLVNALSDQGLNFTLLPNRRTLTDQFIIPTVMEIDGVAQEKDITCRVTRFQYTRRYKQLFPAGMVQVLSQLQIDPSQLTFPLLFDGLRGEQELKYATTMLPKAQFVVLEAPNRVRFERLLTRQDSFDSIGKFSPVNYNTNENQISSFAQLGVPEAINLFSPQETTDILTQLNQGYYSLTDLCDRLKIIVEEQKNYDPLAARVFLETLSGSRTLFIDTTVDTPDFIAQKVMSFLS
ncbi:MAG: AAA family ATPase [Moorea sp. SIOASIH]|uniref:AAA family ATPase n=1 Tax=Moorena sp. SIOASIH TaxID=2607817 RepID=UPI0013B9B52A|nr:AAA family ATPase [Moorena sp. SIOASIH]NEO40897.1 AAA family ATPase [Moorena sp. SIOASIH]